MDFNGNTITLLTSKLFSCIPTFAIKKHHRVFIYYNNIIYILLLVYKSFKMVVNIM